MVQTSARFSRKGRDRSRTCAIQGQAEERFAIGNNFCTPAYPTLDTQTHTDIYTTHALFFCFFEILTPPFRHCRDMSSSASLERYLTLNPKSPQIPQILFLLPIIGRPENSCRYISRVFPSLVPEEAFKTPRRRVLVPPTRRCPALKGGPRLYFSKFQPLFSLTILFIPRPPHD